MCYDLFGSSVKSNHFKICNIKFKLKKMRKIIFEHNIFIEISPSTHRKYMNTLKINVHQVDYIIGSK